MIMPAVTSYLYATPPAPVHQLFMPFLDTHLERKLFLARTFLQLASVPNQFLLNRLSYAWSTMHCTETIE